MYLLNTLIQIKPGHYIQSTLPPPYFHPIRSRPPCSTPRQFVLVVASEFSNIPSSRSLILPVNHNVQWSYPVAKNDSPYNAGWGLHITYCQHKEEVVIFATRSPTSNHIFFIVAGRGVQPPAPSHTNYSGERRMIDSPGSFLLPSVSSHSVGA